MPVVAVCRGPWKQVENVIIAKLSDPAPENCVLIEVMAGQVCQSGMVWEAGEFVFPEGLA